MPGLTQSIALATKYVPLLDAVYKKNSITSIFDAAHPEFVGANAVKVFKTQMDGLADYTRTTGYVKGAVVGTWETLTMECDRGLELNIDRFDQEETLDMAFGTLAGEFIRTQVVPEIDAYRFAKMAGTVGITSTAAAITVGTTDVPGLIDVAEQAFDEDEVNKENRYLFVSPKCYAGLKAKIVRYLANENGVNRQVETYDGMPVIIVPETRFYTAVTLNSGVSDFGYKGTVGGYKINFMMVQKDAVMSVIKIAMPKIFSPDENQEADNWKFQYREYHDLFVFDNKVKGIYMHRDTTALT